MNVSHNPWALGSFTELPRASASPSHSDCLAEAHLPDCGPALSATISGKQLTLSQPLSVGLGF